MHQDKRKRGSTAGQTADKRNNSKPINILDFCFGKSIWVGIAIPL